MKSFGAPSFLRSGAAGQLGAVLLVAFGVFTACGNDTPQLPANGSAGASGKPSSAGKAGKAGKGGEGAEAGQPEEAAGSTGEGAYGGGESGGLAESGGSIGNGGSSGSSAGGTTIGGASGKAGSSGAGGGATTGCGNGKLEAGEACDDGNTKFGDSCSPTCTNVCELCEKDICGPNPDFGGACDDLQGNAMTGPATGSKKSDLCHSLLACYKQTGCAKDKNFLKDCYCGTASATDCSTPGKADGPCSEAIAGASEDRAFAKITLRAVSPQFAVGVASDLLFKCDRGACANECVLGKAQTECQKCSGAVGFEAMAACYANANADPSLSAPLCSAALECAHRTGCALNGVGSCYGVVVSSTLASQGPCFAELSAAGKDLTPQQISQVLLNTGAPGTLGAVASELIQESTFCADTCFASSSGGSGGGAGSSGKAGSSGTGG